MGGWGVWGVRVGGGDEDGCERRIDVFVKIHKKNWVGSGGGGAQGGCEGRIEVFERNVGGCELKIEGIVQCTKRYCTILRK